MNISKQYYLKLFQCLCLDIITQVPSKLTLLPSNKIQETRKQMKIKFRRSFVKKRINSFFSDLRVEFIISSFLSKKIRECVKSSLEAVKSLFTLNKTNRRPCVHKDQRVGQRIRGCFPFNAHAITSVVSPLNKPRIH